MMGILPAGTGNDLIKSAGIPGDPMKALDFLLSHEAYPVDTGSVNDQFFLNVCGTGFDVTVLDCTEHFKSRFRGLTPYLLGLIQAIFRYKPVNLSLEIDGEHRDGRYLVCSIANGQYFGGGIPICPVADIADGLLDLVLIKNVPRSAIPRYLPGLMMKKALTYKITTHRRVEEITLIGEGLRINTDGEVQPMNQVTFRVVPHSLLLVC
jgi:YegS/Rv2252/BmrU family lipid kinase